MNNSVKNKIYRKELVTIHLSGMSHMIVGNNSLTNTRVATFIRHEKRADMQNNQNRSDIYETFRKKKVLEEFISEENF